MAAAAIRTSSIVCGRRTDGVVAVRALVVMIWFSCLFGTGQKLRPLVDSCLGSLVSLRLHLLGGGLPAGARHHASAGAAGAGHALVLVPSAVSRRRTAAGCPVGGCPGRWVRARRARRARVSRWARCGRPARWARALFRHAFGHVGHPDRGARGGHLRIDLDDVARGETRGGVLALGPLMTSAGKYP